ncbi:MAG: 4Fe-4S binding protein, partial [Candidatus Gastranaerophilales bacterium]|nr:4Fe-4S binding protein [Candidatus Gastranaerophilales bacterium]
NYYKEHFFLLSAKIFIMSGIVIDSDKCKNCGICIEVCPFKLIGHSVHANIHGTITAEFQDKDNKCKGCALCAIMCPDIAIKEVRK